MNRGSFWRLSLTARAALGAGFVVLLIIGSIASMLNFSVVKIFKDEDVATLQDILDEVSESLEPGESSTPIPPEALDDTRTVRFRLVYLTGEVLRESPGLASDLPQTLLPAPLDSAWRRKSAHMIGRFRVIGRWCEGSKNMLLAVQDTSRPNLLLRKTQHLLGLVLGLSAAIAAVGIALLARWNLAKLGQLAKQAATIRPGNLTLAVDPETLPPELKQLVLNLKALLTRLDEAFARLTRLNVNMAHELRTPIHGIRLEMERQLEKPGLDPELVSTLEHLIEGQDRLVLTLDQMLFLARAEDPLMAVHVESHRVLHLLHVAAAPFESLLEEKRIHLAITVPGELWLMVDETLALRALHNLLANAIRHSPEGSTITLGGQSEADAVVLRVQDQGEGMPAEFLRMAGQRFRRGASSKHPAASGSGLGLAIVKSILRLHGGSMELQSEPGKGTCVGLRFPVLGGPVG